MFFPCRTELFSVLLQIVRVIEQILYAPNEEEARQIVQKTQMEYAGQVFIDGEEVLDQENGE